MDRSNIKIACPNCHSDDIQQIGLDTYKCNYCKRTFVFNDEARRQAMLEQEKLNLREKEMAHESEIMDKKFQQEKYYHEYEDKRSDQKQRQKIKLYAILGVCIAVLIGVILIINRPPANSIRIPSSSEELVGKEYSIVAAELQDAGFTNVITQPLNDLTPAWLEFSDQTVKTVSIDGITTFKRRTYFNKDATIRISYHSMQEIGEDESWTPDSASAYTDADYNYVQSEFESAGFTNITLVPLEDLQFNKADGEGLVSSVTINKNNTFLINAVYKKNSEVVIEYHSRPLTKDITTGISSDNFYGMDYQEVITSLQIDGFLDISTVKIEDLVNSSELAPGGVSSITIGNKEIFKEDDVFSNYDKVEIVYHVKKPIMTLNIAFSSKQAKNKNYEDIQKQLEDAGFTEVNIQPLNDLNKISLTKPGTIESFSIDGQTVWEENSAFDSNADIQITFHSLKEDAEIEEDVAPAVDITDGVSVSESAKYYRGKKYETAVTQLKDAGFTNIILEAIEDLKTGVVTKDGDIESITIAGNPSFEKGTVFSKDATVRIKYHTFPPEVEPEVPEGMVVLPEGYRNYVGKDYGTVESELRALGFTDISLIPEADLINGAITKENTVKNIAIDENDKFKKGEYFNSDAKIIIIYHIFKPDVSETLKEGEVLVPEGHGKYEGKEYNEVVNAFYSFGFTDIETIPEADLSRGILAKENTVKEVSINGETKFKASAVFTEDAKVIITYHVFKPTNEKSVEDNNNSEDSSILDKAKDAIDSIPLPFKNKDD